jgi:hypothetical protein
MPGLDVGIHLSSQETSIYLHKKEVVVGDGLPGQGAMTAAYHRVTCADTASHFPYNADANFPEFHNVYIDPCSYAAYKKTSVFPEGTIFFKKLQLRPRRLTLAATS